MKKFIVAAAFLVAISSAAWAQTQKPPQRKTYEERMKEKKEAEELRKKEQGEDDKKSTKKTPPARPQRPKRKTAEEKMRERKEAEEQRKAMEGENATEDGVTEDADDNKGKKPSGSNATKQRPPRPTPASRRAKGKEEPVAAPNAAVVNTYYKLPLDAIPQVRNYIEDKEDVDSKSIRRGFIRKQDAERGYLHLQLPADDKFTRIQEYKTSTGKEILAIETNNCSQGECNNTLKFYSTDSSGSWVDVTEKYMPELDKKYILSKIKAKYKKDYSDLENYNNKGYETSEEIYNKAIITGIDADANRIIIKEQYLPLPLYEMVWDGKSKFILKKL